jgi:hypothetical protein
MTGNEILAQEKRVRRQYKNTSDEYNRKIGNEWALYKLQREQSSAMWDYEIKKNSR